jgi:hypothetical protein
VEWTGTMQSCQYVAFAGSVLIAQRPMYDCLQMFQGTFVNGKISEANEGVGGMPET